MPFGDEFDDFGPGGFKIPGSDDPPHGGANDPPFGGGGGPTDLIELVSQLIAGSPELFAPRRRRQGFQGVAQERVPIPRYQYGTRYHPGGRALVGEAGPEVLDLPRGAAVQPAPMPAAGSPGGRFGRRGLGPAFGPRSRFGQRPLGTPAAGGRIPERPGGPGDFGIDIGALYGPDGQVSIPQLLQILTAQGIRSGTFDPLGSPQLAAMARDLVAGSSGARERAATLGADLESGFDPALRSVGRLNARLNTQAESARAYQEALLESARRNQAFIQALLGGPIAGAATRRDPRTGEILAQTAGDIGGTILGGRLGGAGRAGRWTGDEGWM